MPAWKKDQEIEVLNFQAYPISYIEILRLNKQKSHCILSNELHKYFNAGGDNNCFRMIIMQNTYLATGFGFFIH